MLRVDDFLSSLLFLVCRPAGLLTGCHTSFLGVTRNFAVKIFPKQSAGCYRICCASIPARPWLLQRGNGNSATTPIASSSSQNGTSSNASQLISAISQPNLRS